MRHEIGLFWLIAAAGLALPAGCGGAPEGAAIPSGDAGGSDAAVTTDAGPAADAGADARPGPVCTLAAQARTAPTSLYDDFRADLATLQPQAVPARVDQLVADVKAQGGTPLEEAGDRLVFLVRGAPPMGPWSVAGTFTGWKDNAQPMTQVPGTDLYVLDATVARGRSHEYKLLSGTSDAGFTEDPLAQNVVWDGIDHQGVGQFNAVAHPGDGDTSKGRIVRMSGVHATELGDTRDVFVYLPPRYDDGSCAPLPHLVFHDGNESLTRVSFAQVADATYAKTPAASAVLAFVALPSQGVRIDEYTFGTQTALGDAYGDFLLGDLEPALAARFRLCATPGATGLAGASLGGLISTYLAFQKPAHWGYVGAQSASYFWDNDAMITRAGQPPHVAVRFYLDTGCPDDNCDVVRSMNDTLSKQGYDVEYVEAANAQHDWPFWAERLPELLLRFRQGKTGCN